MCQQSAKQADWLVGWHTYLHTKHISCTQHHFIARSTLYVLDINYTDMKHLRLLELQLHPLHLLIHDQYHSLQYLSNHE